MEPYIPLGKKEARAVIGGTAAMFFCNLFYSFSMPMVIPSLLEYYGIMKYYAVILGLSSLLSCIITPIGGKLGDLIGRQRLSIWMSAIRLFFIVLCAIPTNGLVFAILYLSLSITGGLLNSLPPTIISDVTLQSERPKVFGLFGTINGVALLIGLLGGGLIVDGLGPFATFFCFIPFGLASIILLKKYYPNKPAKDMSSIDKRGSLLLAACISCLVIWCNFGGDAFSRTSALGIALLIGFVLLLALLLWYERRIPSPVLDLKAFANRNFTLSALAFFLISPMVTLCSSSLTLFGQKALGLSATMSGTLALPKNIMLFLLPPFLGRWLSRDIRRYRTGFLLCGLFIAVASSLAAFWNTTTPIWVIYPVMLLFGMGTSLQTVCIQPYMQLTTPPEKMGSAAAMNSFSASLGGVITSAVYSIRYNAQYAAAMAQPDGSLATAVANTFQTLALFSCLSGLLIILFTLLLTTRTPRKALVPTAN